MGQFSWICSDCDETVRCDLATPSRKTRGVVLSPFGEKYVERHYEGYGEFDGHDVFDLVVEWNRPVLADKPNFVLPHSGKKLREFEWWDKFSDLSVPIEELAEAARHHEIRCIGIDLACWDEDNAALPFPIKIVKDKNLNYHEVPPAYGDVEQGCECW